VYPSAKGLRAILASVDKVGFYCREKQVVLAAIILIWMASKSIFAKFSHHTSSYLLLFIIIIIIGKSSQRSSSLN